MNFTRFLKQQAYEYPYDPTKNELCRKPNSCFVNAFNNQQVYWERHDLTMVLGSLGVGIMGDEKKDTDVWWEFGSKHFTRAKQFTPRSGSIDAHVWLEDAKGNIYDFVPHNLIWIAGFRGVAIDFKQDEIFEGVSKDQLAKKGLHYLSASAEIQQVLLKKWVKSAKVAFVHIEEA